MFRHPLASHLVYLVAFGALLAVALPAHATIRLAHPNPDPPEKYDRFYTGADPQFIGAGYDWSGVGRRDHIINTEGKNLGGRWATMISDSFFLSAWHYRPLSGDTLFFHHNDHDAQNYDTRVVDSVVQIGSTDLAVGKLTQPVSADVVRYPILSYPTDAQYEGLEIFTFGLNATLKTADDDETAVRLGRNEILDVITLTNGTTTGETILFDYDVTGGVGDDESWLNSGDSGGPSLAIIGGQPALTGIHWAIYSTSDEGFEHYDHSGSIDTLVGTYVDQIRTQVENGGESITVVPEPGTMILFVSAAFMLAVVGWCRRRRRLAS